MGLGSDAHGLLPFIPLSVFFKHWKVIWEALHTLTNLDAGSIFCVILITGCGGGPVGGIVVGATGIVGTGVCNMVDSLLGYI